MRFWLYVSLIVLGHAAVASWHTGKMLPESVNKAWPVREVPAAAVRFLADRTYVNASGQRHSDQHIFDEFFRMIEDAEQYIVADMFLYNSWQGTRPEEHRALADEFTQALVAKKREHPNMPIVVITDPVNQAYGGDISAHLARLRQAGVNVIITNLKPLRDSNPLYSAVWRAVVQWWGNSAGRGWLPHPFQTGGPQVTARTWLSLFNFKANHRKVLAADGAVLITSANPHDGSSAHSNVAVKVDEGLAGDVLTSEAAVARFSGAAWHVPEASGAPSEQAEDKTAPAGSVRVQLLTEGAIREKLLELIAATRPGDSIDVAMFYLAERSIVGALLQAAERGVNARLMLDPNKDAFGRTKNGVPNRPVAHELTTKSNHKINVRWCATHGEQCHSKLVLLRIGDQHVMTAGSTNLTRRNISNYNLETNVLVEANEEVPAIADARAYFEEMWNNADGSKIYTADYSRYADPSLFKTFLYQIQETTGLSSF